ncbi:hypothetical protein [Microbacterium aerolatum]|uniref:hypothetical protein n=1 Tax=Microbacterium aerolatum TaxID=153731 RepID=UPI0038511600
MDAHMTVERWRMQTGRVAVIDLSQHPAAVESLRTLLRSHGAQPVENTPTQAFAADEYDQARSERSRQKKAPAAGGNQREGADQNPYERNQIMASVAPTFEPANETHTLQILRSALTPDAWATETTITDADTDPTVTHFHELTAGRYKMLVAHTIAATDLGTDVVVRWEEPGAGGFVTPEEFAISISSIPDLVAALLKAAAIVSPAREQVSA